LEVENSHQLHDKKNINHLPNQVDAEFAPKEEIVKRKVERRLVDVIPDDLDQFNHCG